MQGLPPYSTGFSVFCLEFQCRLISFIFHLPLVIVNGESLLMRLELIPLKHHSLVSIGDLEFLIYLINFAYNFAMK